MKNSIKTFAIIALMLSFSSVYSQEETRVVKSKSNIKTNRVAGDPVRLGDVKLGTKALKTETGWSIIAPLTEEEANAVAEILKGRDGNVIFNNKAIAPAVMAPLKDVNRKYAITILSEGLSTKQVKALGDLFSKI